jgi:hypothetical protein
LKLEKMKSVDQNTIGPAAGENVPSQGKFAAVKAFVLGRKALFSKQGTVVAGWRSYGGRRLGPYYRLAYREASRQRSLYLGRSEDLADAVRGLLGSLQQPLRNRQAVRRLKSLARASLRRVKAELGRVLAKSGFWLKGYEVRRKKPPLAAASSGPPAAPLVINSSPAFATRRE